MSNENYEYQGGAYMRSETDGALGREASQYKGQRVEQGLGITRVLSNTDRGIADEASQEISPTYKWINGGTRVDESGVMTSLNTNSVNTQDLRPNQGIASSAMSPSGSSQFDLSNPETTIEINGIRASLSIWEQQGLVELGQNGKYQFSGEAQSSTESEAPKAEPEVELSPIDANVDLFHPEIETEYENLINPLDQGAWESSVDEVANALLSAKGGDIDIEALAKASRMGVDETYDNLQKALLMHQAKAMVDLESVGIPREDFQKVIAWARTKAPSSLQKAVKEAIVNRNPQLVKKLGKAYIGANLK